MLEHGFAIATAAATFVLLLIGALVHATGSSLACPDWPLCYGQLMPKMEGGIFFEHGHRMAAATVGLLTLALLGVLWMRRRATGPRTVALGAFAAVLVVFQGVLGGITVLLRLPLAVSTAHLAVSMVFFSLLLVIVFRTRPAAAPRPFASSPAPARSAAAAAAIGVYLQLLLGALVRHTGSGLACGFDVPLCQGAFWPATGPAQLHMAHRIAGVVVAGLVLRAVWATLRDLRDAGRAERRAATRAPLLRATVWTAAVLVIAQILLGALAVLTGIHVGAVTAHFGVGAALLGLMVGTALALSPASHAPSGVPAASPTPDSAPEPAHS